MEITANEIDSIETIGQLDGRPLKMIRTKGGFYICTGRPNGKISEEAIGAGSHPAIVKYNVEKQYPQAQMNMMKSEGMSDAIVEKHSHFLSDNLRKSGHEIYSVQTGTEVEFYVTKHDIKVAEAKGFLNSDTIVLENLNFPKEFTKSMAGATVEKAMGSNIKKMRITKI